MKVKELWWKRKWNNYDERESETTMMKEKVKQTTKTQVQLVTSVRQIYKKNKYR